MTTYTKRSNCIRAARAKLGKDAQQGKDFVLAGSAGSFTWAPAAAKAKSTRETGKRAKLIELISTKDGASLAELQDALGWQPHTVRGAVSTLGQTMKVESLKDERGRVYRVGV